MLQDVRGRGGNSKQVKNDKGWLYSDLSRLFLLVLQ